MFLLISMRTPDFNRLRAALEQVFRVRKTHQIPLSLERTPAEWEKPYLELAHECNLNASIDEAFLEVVNIHKQLALN